MVFTDCYWEIHRNILYVKEAEMKIGLETTLSFLWKVSFSSNLTILESFLLRMTV